MLVLLLLMLMPRCLSASGLHARVFNPELQQDKFRHPTKPPRKTPPPNNSATMATATPALVRAALVATLAAAVALHLDSGVYEAIYKKVWPPSWESAPFLIGCCIFTLAIMVLSFRASSKSKAQQLAIEKKRKLIGELCGPLCNTILRRRCTPPPLYPAAAVPRRC
jgi:hypothetical protein